MKLIGIVVSCLFVYTNAFADVDAPSNMDVYKNIASANHEGFSITLTENFSEGAEARLKTISYDGTVIASMKTDKYPLSTTWLITKNDGGVYVITDGGDQDGRNPQEYLGDVLDEYGPEVVAAWTVCEQEIAEKLVIANAQSQHVGEGIPGVQ